MQPTASALPKLHRLGYQSHTTPERRKRDLLYSREPRLHLLHPLLKQSPPIINVRLVNVGRNLRTSRRGCRALNVRCGRNALPSPVNQCLGLRRPQHLTLPARPRPDLTAAFSRIPIQLALLAAERLHQPLDTNLALQRRPAERQRSPPIAPLHILEQTLVLVGTGHRTGEITAARIHTKHLPAFALPAAPVTVHHPAPLVQFFEVDNARADPPRRQRRRGQRTRFRCRGRRQPRVTEPGVELVERVGRVHLGDC